jgi:SEC-C motif-containing protein
LRRRSFLLMEPTHESMLDAAFEIDQVAAKDRSARWMGTREFLLRHDIVVPDYDRRGAIISLALPERRAPFRDISRYELYELMHDLYVDMKKLGSYDLAGDEPCPCQSGRSFGKCHARRMVSQADLQAAQAAQPEWDDAP